MSGWKKLAAASAAGGEALNVEEVFSTYVYDGNSSNRSITNGIDLSTEGGMVWIKGRTSTTYDFNNTLFDTERGAGYRILTDGTSYQRYNSTSLTSFNTDGFSLGTDGTLLVNWSSNDYVSWTFRKAPKFFDVVTYTGDGSTQTINHNLGVEPGCIIIKRTDAGTTNWQVYHRGLNNGVNPEQYAIQLNESTAQGNGVWGNTAPTSTEFTVAGGQQANGSGMSYVAYLFAHNDGDGEFGPNGDADIIKCGNYSGTGASGNSVDLGFEPQLLMTRRVNVIGSNWYLWDVTRGMANTGSVSVCQRLQANSANKERSNEGPTITSNGFVLDSTSSDTNGTNDEYIYIAIRRGPMAVPESGTDVFDMATLDGTAPTYASSMDVVDMAFHTHKTLSTKDFEVHDRLRQRANSEAGHLVLNDTDAEESSGSLISAGMDYMYGWGDNGNNTSYQSWMWKRAPNYFDVVAYRGNGVSGHTIYHNLGVPPEMVWIKNRDASVNWTVYHSDETGYAHLNSTAAFNTTPILDNVGATSFDLLYSSNLTNTNQNYIAYLFASLDGVSKVGSYTGNGSSQTIDCGFSSGARFILIKRTDSTGDWYMWDTERGIVGGNDPYLKLNTTDAQVTSTDWVDPNNSGFIVNSTTINATSAEYIFYAIA